MAASSMEPSATTILHSPRSPLSASPASSDHPQKANPNPSGNASPKKAWKQRSSSNGTPAPVASIEAGPVIGGPESWPALSESASKVVIKPSPKASEASSGSPSPPPVHQVPMVSSPVKASSGNPNFTPASNRGTQPRPKPIRRNNMPNLANGNSGSMNSAFPVTGSPAGSPHANPVSDASWGGGDSSSNISSNSTTSSNNTFDMHSTNNHRRGSYAGNKWRGNGGGAHNHGGGRRHQEYFDGGHHRGQPRGMRPQYVRGPPPPAAVAPPPPPFIPTSPQPRPQYVPMPFPDMSSQMYYYQVPPSPEMMRGMQFVAHPVASPSPFMMQQLDPQFFTLLMQIEYYFSFENLCKDIFLRRNMDEQGWVPISLVAGFKRVKQITNNLQFIMDTLQLSSVVEVQGDKMRKRNDWMNWLLPPEHKLTHNASSRGPPSQIAISSVTPHLQNLGLEGSNMQGEASLARSSSGNLTEQVQLTGLHLTAGPSQVMGHVDVMGRMLVRSDTF
ncbi:winged-helix DNA-binding transcription factor family protein [Carex rostrata]